MNPVDLENTLQEEEMTFLPTETSKNHMNVNNEKCNNALLTREDLLTLDKREPKWRRFRIILMVAFWVIWLGLLIAAIVIIVLTPKCPHVPSLNFWQSKVGYWVDPFAFRDSDKNLVGDFKGLIEQSNYIKDTLGAGYVIIDNFVANQFSESGNRLGLTTDFKLVDPALGSNNDFRSVVKAYHKKGLQVVVTLDFNSVSATHTWASKYAAPNVPSWVTRSSVSMQRSPYSAFGHGTVDLDLKNTTLLEEIKGVVEYWLNEGADGILLHNAAYFVEDTAQIRAVTAAMNTWSTNAKPSQVYRPESVAVVRTLYEIAKKVSTRTGKQRLLAVNGGNTGFGVNDSVDDDLMFLGSDKQPAADIIVSRQFVRNRGNAQEPAASPLIRSYSQLYAKEHKRLALATATSSDVYHNNTISLASILLLPGSPLIYYGSELGQALTGQKPSSLTVYPKNKLPLVDDQQLCHLPLPWDRDGKTFSPDISDNTFSTLLDAVGIRETIETATAAGRGASPFQLVQSLIKLRESPSLLWGEFKLLSIENLDNPMDAEMFERRAKGYPSFVIVLLNTSKFERMIYFPDYCKKFTPRIIYPPSPTLDVDKLVVGDRVYLKIENGPAVYVFQCHDA